MDYSSWSKLFLDNIFAEVQFNINLDLFSFVLLINKV